MELKKKLIKWGEGLGIYFTKAEIKNYNMSEKDLLTFTKVEMEKIKNE